MQLYIGKLYLRDPDKNLLRIYKKNKKLFECEIIAINNEIWGCELSMENIKKLHKVLGNYIEMKI